MTSTSWLRISITALAAITIAAVAFCEPVAKGLDYGALAEFVATTSFEDFGNSTEGTVIARFEDMQNDRDPAQVWVYQKGALRPGSVQDFDRAFGGKKQQWPPYTLVFAVTQGKKGHYEVVLKTWYDMGLLPDSRGGNEQLWQIARKDGRWVVLDMESTLHWD